MGPTVGNLSFLIMGRAGGSVHGQQGKGGQATSAKLRKAAARLLIVYLLDSSFPPHGQ